MEEMMKNLQSLVKALEAGTAAAAPGALSQGPALQPDDLSPTMANTCHKDEHLILQKMIEVSPVKQTVVQFNRQLSYGQFGGSATMEGNVGQEETSDYVRIMVPMAFYSHIRRYTLAASMVDTVDGKKAEERVAADAAKKIAADIEFDCFRGLADFSNVGVFDGSPAWTPALAGIHGLDLQVRQSDAARNAQDLMFSEFGSSETVIVNVGGTLTQNSIEDASTKASLNWSEASKLVIDPRAMSAYNKISFGKERIILAGSPQEGTGATLRKQWVSNGTVEMEVSHFLRGKWQPGAVRSDSPAAPTFSWSSDTTSGVTTSFIAAEVYTYYVTGCNEHGESAKSASSAATIDADGDEVALTITAGSGTNRYYNVYRSAAGGTAASAKFIGRVIHGSSIVFHDYGNKLPGFTTGFLVDQESMDMCELSPYSRLKLAVTDLSMPEAYYRFCTLRVTLPRRNVLLDNIV